MASSGAASRARASSSKRNSTTPSSMVVDWSTAHCSSPRRTTSPSPPWPPINGIQRILRRSSWDLDSKRAPAWINDRFDSIQRVLNPDLVARLIGNTLTLGSLYALVGIGFVILLRSTGVVNFAQGAFMVVG